MPQHFQQQDRYIENMVNCRCQAIQSFDWGFYTLTLDRNLLSIGKLGIVECKGVFPDGTPFNLPMDDPLPDPINIPGDINNEHVYLAIPLKREQSTEADNESNPDDLARYRTLERQIKDNNVGEDKHFHVNVGGLKTLILTQRESLSAYACIGVARIIEAGADQQLRLDDQYIPPSLNCQADTRIRGFLQEIHGLLNTRGEALGGRVAQVGQGGVSEIADFLMLQLVNRYQPLFEHLLNVAGLHPDQLYRQIVQLTGELSTFFSSGKRPIPFPGYNHDDLHSTFTPVMQELRRLLGQVFEPNAIQIPFSQPKFGVYAAKLPDQQLLDDAIFVLAANAQVPPETLRDRFPPQVTICPVEKIKQYVSSLTSGIAIHPLPVVPRQIPYHAGFTYFELDKSSKQWGELKSSAGFAVHIGGKFPELKLEFWAIRKG